MAAKLCQMELIDYELNYLELWGYWDEGAKNFIDTYRIGPIPIPGLKHETRTTKIKR